MACALEDVSLRDILLGGAMMAAIASAETLLCATALDKLHDGQRTQYNRELCAQGIGNVIRDPAPDYARRLRRAA